MVEKSAQEWCSVISRERKEQLIGTAPQYSRYLFMEVPLPWKGEILESDSIAPKLRSFLRSVTGDKPEDIRFQGLVPDPDYLLIQPEEILLQRNILVCTHGIHDRCCGKFGYSAYDFLKKNADEKTLVWRSSHLGGHRFTPTIADFPCGRFWGRMGKNELSQLLDNNYSEEMINQNYRGLAGLSEEEQVAERELFLKFGNSWPGLLQSVTSQRDSGGGTTVKIATESEIFELSVSAIGQNEVLGDCGGSLKTVIEYQVVFKN